MTAARELFREQRFDVGVAAEWGWRWHAIDTASLPLPAGATEVQRGVEAFSVCGLRAQHVPKLGGFTYDNPFLVSRRCERCGWVVALNRGTVEQEIDFYARTSTKHDALADAGADSGLLRRIFTAILADAPPGRDAESGHRSDLLAHAARHRPVVRLCEHCAEMDDTAAHGDAVCASPVVVCGECTFTAGHWAGEKAGSITGECVVAAPCSVLRALMAHYGLIDPAGSADSVFEGH
jgi:hypothetical protein